MSLKSLDIKSEYRSLVDNIAKEFYIPVLSQAISYKRAVGFFSSSILAEISRGIIELVKNDGKIQLIASPYLSDEDIEAIKKGYSEREIVNRALKNALTEPEGLFEKKALDFLSNLIAAGVLDLRIAFTKSKLALGMYHEKVGIIEDAEGNKIAFSGSMNESANALIANYEAIDVFTSWGVDANRVANKALAFDQIWGNKEENIQTYEFPEIKDEIIAKYKRSNINLQNPDELTCIQKDLLNPENNYDFFKVPEVVRFYDYQRQAISNWKDNDYFGIFDMATGAGKTYTALGALSHLSRSLDGNLAVIIVVPYQHLVEQWVDDIIAFNVNPIIAYSYPGQNWRKEFQNAVNAYNVGARRNFCIIATNSTYALNDFQLILSTIKKNYCFVVDEAHNFGAKQLKELLPKRARYRLALSATFERFRDEEGTSKLREYFGRPCISFSLKEAIQRGFLTSYYYHPVITYLDEVEQEEYADITRKIIKLGGGKISEKDNNPQLELLLIKRARIIAGCHEKVDKLLKTIAPFKNEKYILVYCGATKYDRSDIDDEDDVKQIDEVTRRLNSDLGMKVRRFTSSENRQERIEIKQRFAEGDSLQVITAIKCLDEGVNIPNIRKAFILASSTNPREYVQRRGRVLRRAMGKEYAEIYDFITLPRPLEEVKYCSPETLMFDRSLVRKEFLRMIDFADTARNPLEIDDLREEIIAAYGESIFIDEEE